MDRVDCEMVNKKYKKIKALLDEDFEETIIRTEDFSGWNVDMKEDDEHDK